MYLHVNAKQPIYKLRYFTSESAKHFNEPILIHDLIGDQSSESLKHEMQQKINNKHVFVPDEKTFANIRNRLSNLSLHTNYKGSADESQKIKERQPHLRRISSISSRDTLERYADPFGCGQTRLHSRSSFMSDDREFRISKKKTNTRKNRASEMAALSKLNESFLTPRQNPELFLRRIQLKDKTNGSLRSLSPQSTRSVDSLGKVHLGLLDCLDLKEKLHDVEKIKERYSSDAFLNSLSLYKLRGHEKCLFNGNANSDNMSKGKRICSPDRSVIAAKTTTDESMYIMNNVLSPRLGTDTLMTSFHINKDWEPNKSHMHDNVKAEPISNRHTSTKRKKSVEFNMQPSEINEDELISKPPPPSGEISLKQLKSILKRSNTEHLTNKQYILDDHNDTFVADESYRWKFQLPAIRSPVFSKKPHALASFKKKMYHYGNGVSQEFDHVITNYGNCRQASMIRDQSLQVEQTNAHDNAQIVTQN